MNKIQIPYDRSYLVIDQGRYSMKAVLTPEKKNIPDPLDMDNLNKCLENPIGSKPLSEITRNIDKLLIITSDHTRPLPSRDTLPLLLSHSRRYNADLEIKILVATGCHRPMKDSEILERFGRDISEKEQIINHNAFDDKNMVHKGTLPSGNPLWLNSLVDWADVIIAEGFIEPHFFAGYSGGRKCILPGIAFQKTIFSNHCSEFIASMNSRTGIINGNPIHKDMVYASKQTKLSFILNVVLNSDKKIIAAFAGHPETAHEEGCNFVKRVFNVKSVPADIVITSNGGYPLDQNIYQAVKGMTAAELCVKPGGVIIMVAGCSDGHGGEAFYHWFKSRKTPYDVLKAIDGIPAGDTMADQWQAQILARILNKNSVIMVTDIKNRQEVLSMHMKYARTVEQAIETARSVTGDFAEIVVIPDGVGIIMD